MSTVLDLMKDRILPVPPSWLMQKTGLSHEGLYLQLVSLEAQGLAGFHANYFPREGHVAEAGWYATETYSKSR